MSIDLSESRPSTLAAHSFLPSLSEIISSHISSLALSIIIRKKQTPPSLDLFSILFPSLQSEPMSESIEKIRSIFDRPKEHLYDPHKVIGLKLLLLQESVSKDQILEALKVVNPKAQGYIESCYKRLYGVSVEQAAEHNLAISLLKIQSGDSSIFDYIHYQMELGQVPVFCDISICEHFHHISNLLHLRLNLLHESFSYLISLEDLGQFKDLFQAYPKELQKEFCSFILEGHPEVVLKHFKTLSPLISLVEVFCKHKHLIKEIAHLDLSQEERRTLFMQLRSDYRFSSEYIVKHLNDFRFEKMILIELISSLPLYLILQAFENDLLEHHEIDQILQKALITKGLEIFTIIPRLPLAEDKITDFFNQALDHFQEPQIISYFFEDDRLISSKERLFEKVVSILAHLTSSDLCYSIHTLIDFAPEMYQDEMKMIIASALHRASKINPKLIPEDLNQGLLAVLNLLSAIDTTSFNYQGMLVALTPIFTVISDEIWQGLFSWTSHPSSDVKAKTFAAARTLLEHHPREINPKIFFPVITQIGKCRNEEISNKALILLSRILLLEKKSQLFFKSISTSSNKLLPRLVLPMLFAIALFDTEGLELLQKRLIELRAPLRDNNTLLMQALILALSSFKGDVESIHTALSSDDILKIRSNLYKMYFLEKFGIARSLPSKWTQSDISTITATAWTNVFAVDTIENPSFQARFEEAFYTPRMEGMLEVYAAKKNPSFLAQLGVFVKSVTSNTFRSLRYAPKHSKHLAFISERHHDIFESWRELAPFTLVKECIDEETILKTSLAEHIKELAGKQAIGYVHHLLSIADCKSPLEEEIFTILSSKLSFIDYQRALLLLSSLPVDNQIRASMVKNPLADQDDIQEMLHVGLSDRYDDLFLCSTEPSSSCLRVDGDSTYNECLMGCVMDGKNQVLVITNSEGRIVARRLFRLLLDEEYRPVLYLDKQYGNCHKLIELSMHLLAKKRAQELSLPLFCFDDVPGLTHPSLSFIQSLDSPSSKEYFDGIGIVVNGVFKTRAKHQMAHT